MRRLAVLALLLLVGCPDSQPANPPATNREPTPEPAPPAKPAEEAPATAQADAKLPEMRYYAFDG